MRILDLVTILCATLLVGNEFAVSAFVNPILWQLEPVAQSRALSLAAKSLGAVMPFWYASSLILMIAESILRRHQPAFFWIAAAAALWVAVIIFTITMLVPINNRIAKLDSASSHAIDWRAQHRHWDSLHRLRIALITIAAGLLVNGLLG